MMKNDKYYTKLSIAKRCIDFTKEHIQNFDDYILLEPSAGNGSFSSQLQNCEAYDLYPESQTIKKLNFLNYLPDLNKKYIVIGNPLLVSVQMMLYYFLINQQLSLIILL